MEAPAHSPSLIQVQELRVTYHSGGRDLTVLDLPRWEVEGGAQLAIFGPSGSGKSTLLHLLSGVIRPTSGVLRVCGLDLVPMSEAARDAFRARHVGYVFQGHNLLPGYTALENVLLGSTFGPGAPNLAAARALLATMGLEDRLQHPPSALSLGEQQRVAIARALVKRPELVLADEPTASLDPRSSKRVLALLRSACREAGSTLILVTHEREVLAEFEQALSFAELNRAWRDCEDPA